MEKTLLGYPQQQQCLTGGGSELIERVIENNRRVKNIHVLMAASLYFFLRIAVMTLAQSIA